MSQAPRPRSPSDLPRASDLPPSSGGGSRVMGGGKEGDPPLRPPPITHHPSPVEPPPREARPVTVRTRVELDGYPLELEITLDLRRIRALPGFLREQGLAPPPAALTFARTAEGHPICPKHGVRMRLHEKQGDEWWSHKTLGSRGEELWCRGYPGPDSAGFNGTVPGGEGP